VVPTDSAYLRAVAGGKSQGSVHKPARYPRVVRTRFDPDRPAPVDHNLPSLLGFAALLGAFAAAVVAAWHFGGKRK